MDVFNSFFTIFKLIGNFIFSSSYFSILYFSFFILGMLVLILYLLGVIE